MPPDSYNDMSTPGNRPMSAPALAYQPERPKHYNPPIALIGCGGVTQYHLRAYRAMGLNVVALCDPQEQCARNRQREYFPEARVYTDFRDVLRRDDIEVVDLATHPQDRACLIPQAIDAGKHVLSQKPFVLDLDLGERFADQAEKKNALLAINHNGRWAPHFSYLRAAVREGLLGDLFGVHLACHWNHEWIRHTAFNRVHHIVLYDYAIHWFDMLNCLLGHRAPRRAFSTLTRAAHQQSAPPLLGQCLIEFEGAQASLVFDAAVTAGPLDHGYVTGAAGSLHYAGPDLNEPHRVTIHTAEGYASPDLTGQWLHEGFMGTMGELLCAIEEKRQPFNSARSSLGGLALCFAAVRSAESGQPEEVGSVRQANMETCGVKPL